MDEAVRTPNPSTDEPTQIRLPVQGMHCTGCAQSIELVLGQEDGIARIAVHYPTAQAEIAYHPAVRSLPEIVELIGKQGFSVPQVEARMAVRGMTCTGCADTVERTLAGTDGVLAAEVSFPREEVRLSYLPDQVRLPVLQERVTHAGYTLVPLSAPSAGANAPDSSIQADLRRRRLKLSIALACSAAIFGLNMILPLFLVLPQAVHEWTVLGLASIVQIWIGQEFHVRAWRSLRILHPNMDTLVSLGSNVAFGTGLATLLLDLDRNVFPLFFESAAFIVTFIYLGRFLEARARHQTGHAITQLLALQPDMAHVVRDKHEQAVALEQVQLADTLVVRAGDTVPVDGIVIDGESTVDESMLSGESLPVYKQAGDSVWGGTVNREGTFRFEARAIGADTAAARIADTVQRALMSKAPVQSLADRVARVFVPVILLLALVTGLVWTFVGAPLYFPDTSPLSIGLMFAAAVLLISCPCALGLATPTAMIAGTTRAARDGILVKDASSLQHLAGVDALAFDKTGTVTLGEPQVQELVVSPAARDTTAERTMLHWAASALQGSAHPIGQAIQTAAAAKGLELSRMEGFQSYTGRGVEARHGTHRIRVGSRDFLAAQNLDLDDLEALTAPLQAKGLNVTYVADNDQVLGCFGIADSLRPDAHPLVASLRDQNLAIRMLSGDNEATARTVAHQMGLDPATEVEYEMQPADKAAVIQRLQAEGHIVCMVGDGVNDAPALAQADVGMAMVSGQNLALEAADVGILHQTLSRIPAALRLGQRTLRVVKQNLFWAFFYNVAAIPLAAGLFVPFLGRAFKLNPAVAAGAMALSSIFVVWNSLRIRRFHLQ